MVLFLHLQGAFWGLVCGFVIGLIRAVLDFVYGVPSCGQVDNRPAMIKDFHYLHFAAFVYGLTLILVIGFSFLTDPVPPYKVSIGGSGGLGGTCPSPGKIQSGTIPITLEETNRSKAISIVVYMISKGQILGF